MLTCDECGCLVDPDATELHQDWHEKLVTVPTSPFAEGGPVANPNRVRVDEHGFAYLDC